MIRWIPPIRDLNTGVDASDPSVWHQQFWMEIAGHLANMIDKYEGRFPQNFVMAVLMQMTAQWLYMTRHDDWEYVMTQLTDKVIDQFREIESAKANCRGMQ